MDNEKNNNQFQIELSPEIAEGVYANLAIITHSSAEVLMDFIRILPGTANAKVKSRVVMAPEHAKRLLMALQDNIVKYERTFGQIRIPEAEPRTATPFDIQKGEA